MTTLFVTDKSTGQLVGVDIDNPTGSLYVRDANTGNLIQVDLASPTGLLHIVDADTGEIVEIDYDNPVAAFNVNDPNTGEIIEVDLSNPTGTLYCLDENTGEFIAVDLSTAKFIYNNGSAIPIAAGDTEAPTVSITLSQYTFTFGDTATVTFTFSEEVMNFLVDDIESPNGGLSSFGVTGNPLVYTAIFTPANGVSDNTNVLVVGTDWTDLNGNHPADTTTSNNYTVNTPAPSQPTGLTATPVSTSQINLAWVDNATNETAYKIYRSTDNVIYSQIGTDQAAGTQAYSDSTITAGTHYYYKVAAVNPAGETLSTNASANTLTYLLSNYWKLDESSAGSSPVTRVDSVGSKNLTDNNTCPSTTGVLSNGVQFTAASSEFLSNTNFALGNFDFTFYGWFYLDALVSNQSILGSSSGKLWLRQQASGSIVLRLNDGSDHECATGTTPSNGNWHFFVAWYDSSLDKQFVQFDNGTVAEVANTGGVSTGTFTLQLGAHVSIFNLGGRLDEVGYMTRVLTSGERTSLYNSGAGKTYPF